MLGLSLYEAEACPLHPRMLISPFSLLMSFCVTLLSSCGEAAISTSSVNMGVKRLVADAIIAFTFSGVGISGLGASSLYHGLVHLITCFSQYFWYE